MSKFTEALKKNKKMTDEIMKRICEAEKAFYQEVKNKLDIDINPT